MALQFEEIQQLATETGLEGSRLINLQELAKELQEILNLELDGLNISSLNMLRQEIVDCISGNKILIGRIDRLGFSQGRTEEYTPECLDDGIDELKLLKTNISRLVWICRKLLLAGGQRLTKQAVSENINNNVWEY